MDKRNRNGIISFVVSAILIILYNFCYIPFWVNCVMLLGLIVIYNCVDLPGDRDK